MSALQEYAIDRAKGVTEHWVRLAPNAPVERFIAQAILDARADAYEIAGWRDAAEVCRTESAALGDVAIQTVVTQVVA